MYTHQILTGQIIAAAISVHKQLGPGLLESVYRDCLGVELKHLGIAYQKELEIPLRFRDTIVHNAFRMDLLVEDTIILEIKSVNALLPVHDAQLLTYLKLTGKQVGLLINFHVPVLKQGIRRLAL